MTWKYMVWNGITVSMLIILLVKFKEIKKKKKKLGLQIITIFMQFKLQSINYSLKILLK